MPVNGVTTTLTPTNASDAQFRAWGSAISAKLVASGFAVTADTGQINWTTVTVPVAVNTAAGYEMYDFADTLQATAPIRFKIEYGTGAASVNNPSIWLTFGTGSNGTGTLSGNISTRQQIYSTAYATNALSCYWSGDTNHFTAGLFANGTGSTGGITMIFTFERTKDTNGDDTNQGILFLFKPTTNSNSYNTIAWDRTIGTLSTETTLGMLLPAGTTGKNGVQVATYPILLANGPFLNPPLGMLAYFHGDITAFATITFEIYGISHTFMPLGSTATAPTTARTSGTVALMTRYD